MDTHGTEIAMHGSEADQSTERELNYTNNAYYLSNWYPIESATSKKPA